MQRRAGFCCHPAENQTASQPTVGPTVVASLCILSFLQQVHERPAPPTKPLPPDPALAPPQVKCGPHLDLCGGVCACVCARSVLSRLVSSVVQTWLVVVLVLVL